MLVIHIISTEDTNDFSGIYRGLNATVLINPSARIAKEAIIDENEIIVLIGHGTENGLLNSKLNGYIIDSQWVNLLRNKIVIGIWCYAGNFADRYGLTGFFTSNFISNVNELQDVGFNNFTHSDIIIQSENVKFGNMLNKYLRNSVPVDRWIDDLQQHASLYPFVQYNYEALMCNIE